VNRRVATVVSGLLVCVAGIIVSFLSEHAYQHCVVQIGSGMEPVPSAGRSGINCTVANWSHALAIAAVVCGALAALLATIVILRDRPAPIGDQDS
jgi:hypothetical protein